MTDAVPHGSPWRDEELDALVATYFGMLDDELAGRAYVKAHVVRPLIAATGRTHRSVEYKLMNLSAVLDALGLWFLPRSRGRGTAEGGGGGIRGYRPMPNIQRAIFGAVDRFLTAAPDRLYPAFPLTPAEAGVEAFSAPGWSEDAILYEAPPPVLTPHPPRPEPLERLVRKWDPPTRDFRNRALGEAGEHAVYRSEHARLRAADRPDLARRVRWVAKEDGDGAGYDVLSFDADTGVLPLLAGGVPAKPGRGADAGWR